MLEPAAAAPRSINLERWAKLATIDRETLRHTLYRLLDLPSEARVEWLATRASGDCRDILDGLIEPEGATYSGLKHKVLRELVARPAAQPGDRFGDWRVEERIGHGGMGEVYRARRVASDFEQVAAIKLLPPLLSDDAAHQCFRSERKHLAQLGRLIDGGVTESGQQYLVMEYASRGSLLVYCDSNRIDLRGRLMLFCELCDAVTHMHGEKLIHCDIKPENVLVGADGHVHLIDLGIARPLDGRRGTALPRHSLRFTERYAAPEQRSPSHLSVATDVFCLGRVLEELLAGADVWTAVTRDAQWTPLRRRFRRGRDPDVVAAQRDLAAADLARCLGERADVILRQAMAFDPAARHSSVAALKADVMRYMASLPNPSLSNGDLLRRFLHRLGGPMMLISGAVAAACVGAGYWLGLRA